MDQIASEVNSLFSLVTRLSPCVTLEVYQGELLVAMPSELKTKLEDRRDILFEFRPVFVVISNISSSLQKNIRIKFPKETDYPPELFYNNDKIPVSLNWDEEKCQLMIDSLDPFVRVSIVSYPRIEDCDKFNDKEITCIVSDKILTRFQRRLGALKQFVKDFLSYPLIIKFSLVSWLIPVIMFMLLFMFMFFPTSDKVLLDRAVSRLGSGCIMKVMQVTTSLRSKIEGSNLPLEYVLFINNVSTMEELERQDRVVICEPS